VRPDRPALRLRHGNGWALTVPVDSRA
jgi:hypothetical protein